MHGDLAEWVSKLEGIVKENERCGDDCISDDKSVSHQTDFVSPINFVFGDEEDPNVNDDEINGCEEEGRIAAATTANAVIQYNNTHHQVTTDNVITPIGTPIRKEKSTECDLSAVESSYDDNINELKNASSTQSLSIRSSFGIELANLGRRSSSYDKASPMWGMEEYLYVRGHFKETEPLSLYSELEPELSSISNLGGIVPQEQLLLKWEEEVRTSTDMHLKNEGRIESGTQPLSFPVHRAVFCGMNAKLLGSKLLYPKWREAINDVDEKGNTPLLLAIKLRLFDVAEILLYHGAKLHVGDPKLPESVNCSFGVLEEAIFSGNQDFLREVYLCLQLEQWNRWKVKALQLSRTLAELPDFYIEMHWRFRSHNFLLPLVKAVAPSDTYRIWKRGTQLRIDCSIKGYTKRMFIERGTVSVIFTGERMSESEDGGTSYYPNELLKYDHDKKKVYGVLRKIQQPTVDELKKICKGLVGGTGGGKYVDAYIWNTKDLLYKVDHNGHKDNMRTFEGWETVKSKVLGVASMEIYRKHRMMRTLSDLSAEMYFSKCSSIPDDIEDKGKLRKRIVWDINAEMWMCKTFPISLSELVPVLEALSVRSSSEHGGVEWDEREKGIYTLTQLLKTEGIAKSGFPVHINLPIYFGIYAKVTFKGDCRLLNENELFPSLFDVPSGYTYSKKLQQARLRDYGT